MDKQLIRMVWIDFQAQHDCSVDQMLCSPQLRNQFLEAARLATQSNDEFQLLWSVVSLRKSKRLPSHN